MRVHRATSRINEAAVRRQAWKSTALALVFTTGSAFAVVPESPEIRGQVVDADSGRPIAGAIVIANIGGDGGSLFGHGHHRQLYCTAVRTDYEGRFRIPQWTWSGRRSMSLDRFGANLIAYHPDYTFYRPDGLASVHQAIYQVPFVGTPLKPMSEATITMRRFSKGDNNAWRQKIGLPIDWFSCDWDADVQNAELLWDALREEVEAFDAANAESGFSGQKGRLERATGRPASSPPGVIGTPPVDIPARIAIPPGSSAPAR